MSLMDELDNDARGELRDAVVTAKLAERTDSEWETKGPNKNTHYELQFGPSPEEEVYVYVERYDGPAPGVEVMLWIDKHWFTDDALEANYPLPEDGFDPLGDFADEILRIVADVLDADHTPSFLFQQYAPPSMVFTTTFYLD